MLPLIGTVTLGSTLLSLLLGQVSVGLPLLGVILASLMLISIRA